MEKMVEINVYSNRDKLYDTKLKQIEQHQSISPKNNELIKKFGNYLISNGRTGKYTIGKRWAQLIYLTEWLDKDFDKAEITDIQNLIVVLQNTNKSEETKADYRRTLKQFYSRFEDVDERLLSDDFRTRETTKKIYKFLKKDVSLSCKNKKIDPNEVINDVNLKKVLEQGCRTAQEKAIFSLFHESGARTPLSSFHLKQETPSETTGETTS